MFKVNATLDYSKGSVVVLYHLQIIQLNLITISLTGYVDRLEPIMPAYSFEHKKAKALSIMPV